MDASQYKTASKQNLCIQFLKQVQDNVLARYRENDKGNAYCYEIGQLVIQSTCRRRGGEERGGVDRYSDDQVYVMLFAYPIILPPASRILSLGNAITLFDCFSKWRLRTCLYQVVSPVVRQDTTTNNVRYWTSWPQWGPCFWHFQLCNSHNFVIPWG
jgi:hypothetical protein